LIWKSLGVLLGAVTLIILGVVGLARVTVPDEPNFAEGLEEGGTDADTFLETLPIAVGGQLELSGAKEGTVVVDQNVNGPSYGLGNSKTRIFFEGSPLSVSQMSHDGLTFFPEPEDCEFTTGVQNEETGITAVKMSCPELVDIRGNGTLTVEGYLALPASLVLAEEIPDTGGVLTVGKEEWGVTLPMLMIVGFGGFSIEGSENGLWLGDSEYVRGVFLEHNADLDTLTPHSVIYDGRIHEIADGACITQEEVVMILSPEAEMRALTLSCQDVEIPGMGAVGIEGTVVYDRVVIIEAP
jgi:hypothetical protein